MITLTPACHLYLKDHYRFSSIFHGSAARFHMLGNFCVFCNYSIITHWVLVSGRQCAGFCPQQQGGSGCAMFNYKLRASDSGLMPPPSFLYPWYKCTWKVVKASRSPSLKTSREFCFNFPKSVYIVLYICVANHSSLMYVQSNISMYYRQGNTIS